MSKALSRVTRLTLFLASTISSAVITQPLGALAQPANSPGSRQMTAQNRPYIVPAECAGEEDVRVTILKNKLSIREVSDNQVSHPFADSISSTVAPA